MLPNLKLTLDHILCRQTTPIKDVIITPVKVKSLYIKSSWTTVHIRLDPKWNETIITFYSVSSPELQTNIKHLVSNI